MMQRELEPIYEFASQAQLADLYQLVLFELRGRVPLREYPNSTVIAIHDDGLPEIDGSPPAHELVIPNAAVKLVVPQAHAYLQLSEEAGTTLELGHVSAYYDVHEGYEDTFCPPVCAFALAKNPSSGVRETIFCITDGADGWESDRFSVPAYQLRSLPLADLETDQAIAQLLNNYEEEQATGINRLVRGEYLALREIIVNLEAILSATV